MAPTLFIGSSGESALVAEAVHSLLERRGIEPTTWTNGVFGLNECGLESLLARTAEFDFACFILRKDDVKVSRGKRAHVARDNVVLEIGLFLGALGRERVFIVHERENMPDLPSDLDGLHFLDYDARRAERNLTNLRAALTAPCIEIAEKVQRVGPRRPGAHQAAGAPAELKVSPLDDDNTRWRNMSERLERCRRSELVRFISITGKNFLLPHFEVREDIHARLGPRALSHHVRLRGLVLAPDAAEAEFRSVIESPNAAREHRLLMRDADVVADLPEQYRQAGLDPALLRHVELKYSTVGLSFGLWLFSDVAFVEPFHFGKRRDVPHLCGFAQLGVPKDTEEFHLLDRHFEVLWTHARYVPWSRQRDAD